MEQKRYTNHGGGGDGGGRQEVDTLDEPSGPHRPTTTNQNDDPDENREEPESNDGNDDDDVGNDENNEDDDESSVASVATVEADCDITNSLPFSIFCQRVEKLWLQRSTKSDNIGIQTTTTSGKTTKKRIKKWTETEKKNYILPAPMLKETLRHQSLFPLFRLLLPDIDNSRHIAMKEKLIAQVYCEALGLEKENAAYKMLYGFTDPQKAPTDCVGDLSLVVQHVMAQRIPTTPSRTTIGEINQLLDDLVDLKRRLNERKGIGMGGKSHQHEWRLEKKKKTITSPTKANVPPPNLAKLRAQWLKRVMHQKSLSPLEHKWLVRILLQKMEFGIGWRLLLSWYNPYALELWNAHNSLKNLCSKLANENYYNERQRMEDWKRQQEQQEGSGGGGGNMEAAANKWLPQALPATLGNTISPMLSERTTFAKCLTQLQENHQRYLKSSSLFRPIPLALKFPAFCAEIKLDGERMIVHMERQPQQQQKGRVTMHTRNGKWYSQLYRQV
jgi:DNA ligase N terminus